MLSSTLRNSISEATTSCPLYMWPNRTDPHRSRFHRGPTKHQSGCKGLSAPSYTREILKVRAHLNQSWNKWTGKEATLKIQNNRQQFTQVLHSQKWRASLQALPVGFAVTMQRIKCVLSPVWIMWWMERGREENRASSVEKENRHNFGWMTRINTNWGKLSCGCEP